MQIINKKGFTLIELLVVIAIIGILASIMVVSLTNAQKKARDAKRQSELNQLMTALTLYADDNPTVLYPAVSCDSTNDTATAGCVFNSTCTTGNTANPICNEYMAAPLASVPSGSTTYQYEYVYDNSTTPYTYAAYVLLEAPPSTTYYCIDSSGKAGTAASAPAAAVCP